MPRVGKVFISVNDEDKRSFASIARDFVRLGFSLVATHGTANVLRAMGLPVEEVAKVHEGGTLIKDMVASGEIVLMINTPFGHATRDDGYELRLEAVKHGVSYVTTLAAAQAVVAALDVLRDGELPLVALQDMPQWECGERR